jgi:hypothetical protein
VAERWVAPFPYGYPAAAESVGSVASPLLAGFSFALVGLVVPTPEHFRWPNATLAVLFVAGALFIASVQCWFWARQYEITPEDIDLWIPEYPQGRKQALQRLHSIAFYRWNGRMNRAYRLAILFLLVGVMLVLVPPGHVSWLRSVAVALAALASLAEATWIAAIWFLHGSPSMAYDDQPDVPRDNVRFLELRRYVPLRRLARLLVPLPRIRLTEEERSS